MDALREIIKLEGKVILFLKNRKFETSL